MAKFTKLCEQNTGKGKGKVKEKHTSCHYFGVTEGENGKRR
jgi:hypothetical protein